MSDQELIAVEGGAIKWGILSILGGIVALIGGFVDGWIRPMRCY